MSLAIDPVTGEATILSFGHRNGGGVAALDGRFWLFEHGVRGGDEINLIEAGNNYGWPYETYGTDYFVGTWPPDATLGTHEGGYEVPRYAFVPSVAPSSMTVYQGALFPEWQGDLVAGTLRGQAVYRIRLNGDQVVYAEPIPVSARVRDITVDGRGRIFLLTDKREEVLVLDDSALEPADSMVAEARQTLAGCNSCHQIDPLDQAGYPAPSLVNVSLREIGSVPGFGYSDALAGLDGVWSKANLRLYLREPDTVAPGTSMPRQDLEETEIRDILTALHTISPDADTLASEARTIGAAQ
ncbi:MAG: PQQ-dependent sugar dehydrogenase [Planctomycetota bacterium]